MDSEITDIEIIKKIINRDSKALESLYDRYSPVLFTLIKRIVGDQSKAEEILSEVFVIIWLKSEKYDINFQNLYVWLINLARNKALDYKRREESLLSDEYNDEYENKNIIPILSSHVPNGELSKSFSTVEKIQTAFHNLTEAQQYVLSLAYYDGLSESEIAAKLNIPVLTVKSKIRVALNSIKENLANEVNQ